MVNSPAKELWGQMSGLRVAPPPTVAPNLMPGWSTRGGGWASCPQCQLPIPLWGPHITNCQAQGRIPHPHQPPAPAPPDLPETRPLFWGQIPEPVGPIFTLYTVERLALWNLLEGM